MLVMLGQGYCLNLGQERMDSMKSWAGIYRGRRQEGVFVV